MAYEQGPSRVIVTTEGRRGKGIILWTRVLCGVLAALCVAGGVVVAMAEKTRTVQLLAAFEFGVFTAISLLGAYLLPRYGVPRGTWTLDEAGVEYAPLSGPNQHLSWHEVEAVHWGSYLVRLRGDGIVITVYLDWESPETQQAARNLMRRCLEKDFEPLEGPPANIPRDVRARWRVRTVITATIATLVFAAGSALLQYFDPYARWRFIGLGWVVLWLAIFLAWIVAAGRRIRKRYPEWRTRGPGP